MLDTSSDFWEFVDDTELSKSLVFAIISGTNAIFLCTRSRWTSSKGLKEFIVRNSGFN